ncbi:MAG: ATP-dependent DNA helicase RecG [Elusimicrobia bacterium]|nr:ATP-dependent DNA helicase RecG [Elusimicrobiota bacterium]
MPENALDNPVQFLKGIGPKRAQLLSRLGIATLGDLLHHLPRAWENRRPTPFEQGPEDGSFPGAVTGPVVVRGRVMKAGEIRAGMHLLLFIATLKPHDSPEYIEALWFKRRSRTYDVFAGIKKDMVPGADVWIVGRAEPGLLRSRKIRVEEYYLFSDPKASLHVDRITPLYPLTEGLTQRRMREAMAGALNAGASQLREVLPLSLLQKRRLLALPQALPAAHFPRSDPELEEARRRLAYEELLLLELAWTFKRRQTKALLKAYGYEIKRTLLTPLKARLGFEFTPAQKRVINEIFEDMRGPNPMTRLLQGDVGSGKTVVALAALLLAVENGYQGAFMAPTEILAEQHLWTFNQFLKGLPVRMELLSSRIAAKERKQALERVRSGEADIVIGTHALLEGDVLFKNLRLAVIDEQHRFGVRQRTTLRRKGPPLDLLLMTATPIPRTLSLALYGDLDVSTIDEMPPGRRYPSTNHVQEQEAFEAARREAAAGRQVYIVYPIIEESAKLDLKAAMLEYERIKTRVFPEFKVALVHGRMPPKKKVGAMEEFAKGRCNVLVATPVIEVGVDVPNATVMIVQNADRFGLASLHQLRGRIGRGAAESRCFLIADPSTPQARHRIATLCETTDGFRISEEDLKLRGPGEILGVEQHGDISLKTADLLRDCDLLAGAREDAEELLSKDPKLLAEENLPLNRKLYRRYEKNLRTIDLA